MNLNMILDLQSPLKPFWISDLRKFKFLYIQFHCIFDNSHSIHINSDSNANESMSCIDGLDTKWINSLCPVAFSYLYLYTKKCCIFFIVLYVLLAKHFFHLPFVPFKKYLKSISDGFKCKLTFRFQWFPVWCSAQYDFFVGSFKWVECWWCKYASSLLIMTISLQDLCECLKFLSKHQLFAHLSSNSEKND